MEVEFGKGRSFTGLFSTISYKPQVLKLFLVARLKITEMVAAEKNHTANKKADKLVSHTRRVLQDMT